LALPKIQISNLLIREQEHLEGNFDRDNCKEKFEPAHKFDYPRETFDFLGVAFDKVGWKNIGPELQGNVKIRHPLLDRITVRSLPYLLSRTRLASQR
jgi:hypothetical protein